MHSTIQVSRGILLSTPSLTLSTTRTWDAVSALPPLSPRSPPSLEDGKHDACAASAVIWLNRLFPPLWIFHHCQIAPYLPSSLSFSLTLSLSIWRPLHHPPTPHPLLVFPLNKLSRTPVYQEVFGLGQCTGCAHMVNKQIEKDGKKKLKGVIKHWTCLHAKCMLCREWLHTQRN